MTGLAKQLLADPLTRLMLTIRKRIPNARLAGVFGPGGGFMAWHIVGGLPTIPMSGLHDDDEAAWIEAGERLGIKL